MQLSRTTLIGALTETNVGGRANNGATRNKKKGIGERHYGPPCRSLAGSADFQCERPQWETALHTARALMPCTVSTRAWLMERAGIVAD